MTWPAPLRGGRRRTFAIVEAMLVFAAAAMVCVHRGRGREEPRQHDATAEARVAQSRGRVVHAPTIHMGLGHCGRFNSGCLSPDGRVVATGGTDGTVCLWDVATGRELQKVRAHSRSVRWLRFSPDGQRVFSVSQVGPMSIWEVMTGKKEEVPLPETCWSKSVAFSRDMRLMATADHHGGLAVWDLTTGGLAHTLREQGCGTFMPPEDDELDFRPGQHALAFSPHGQLLACCLGYHCGMWDLGTQQHATVPESFAGGIAFSPDGRALAGAHFNGLTFWDVASGSKIMTIARQEVPHAPLGFSPDGRLVASTVRRGVLGLWSVDTGKPVRMISAQQNRIYHVAFGSDGRRLLSVAPDTVKLWDVASGTPIQTWRKRIGRIHSVCFSPDGRLLATGDDSNAARIWDVGAGRLLATLKGHAGSVWAVAFSPDGRELATASDDRTTRLWDVAAGRKIRTLTGHTRAVLAVAFSPDGKRLATGSGDQTAKLWDAETGAELREFQRRTREVGSVAFSPDGRWLAESPSWEWVDSGPVKVWDAATGELHWSLSPSYASRFVQFSHDGHLMVTGGGSQLRLWHVAARGKLGRLRGQSSDVTSGCFSPDGRFVASGSIDQTVRLWDVATRKEVRALMGHTQPVRSVSFSPDGRRLATAGHDGVVKVWDPYHGVLLGELAAIGVDGEYVAWTPGGYFGATPGAEELVCAQVGTRSRPLAGYRGRFCRPDMVARSLSDPPEMYVGLGHSSHISGPWLSPDAQLLATASTDRTVRLWDLATAREILTLRGHTGSVRMAVFSPDARLVASSSADSTVRLWDLASGREVLRLGGGSKWARRPAFSPDGALLATGGAGKLIRLWDVATGALARTLKLSAGSSQGMWFSPDGRLIAAADSRGAVRLCDVKTGDVVGKIDADARGVDAVAFSPGGQVLATGGSDRTAKLWEVATGRLLHTFGGPNHAVEVRFEQLAFTPDGQLLLSGERGGMRLWDPAAGKEVRGPGLRGGHFVPACVAPCFGHADRMLIAGAPGQWALWDLGRRWRVRTPGVRTRPVWAVAISPDGRLLATAGCHRFVKLWDLSTGRLVRTCDEHGSPVRSLAFSSDGRLLASAGDGVAKIWDVAIGAEVRSWGDCYPGLAFRPGEHVLASQGEKGAVKLWDASTDKEVATMASAAPKDDKRARSVGPPRPRAVGFSPDGRLLAKGGSLGMLAFGGAGRRLARGCGGVTLWDVATGEQVRSLPPYRTRRPRDPVGGRFAKGEASHSVWILDLASDQAASEFVHPAPVVALAMHTDGKILATGDAEGVVRLWDSHAGKVVHVIAAHGGKVWAVAFSPNGRWLVTGSDDGTVKVWSVSSGSLLATLAAVAMEDPKLVWPTTYGSKVAGTDDYITWTPEGYFVATPAAEALVSVRVGGRVMPLGEYRDLFHRPDLVSEKLAGKSLPTAH